MNRLAFHAPMKPPGHRVPSGDRAVARGLLAALAGGAEGWRPETVSDFRAREPEGSATAQAALLAEARAEAARLIVRGRAEGWRLWVSYHNYYKAPDLLGPAVTRALGIPYVIFEASRAAKRLSGPWADFERRAGAACDAADLLVSFTARDQEALAAARRPGQALMLLPPFLDREALPPAARPAAPGQLVTVAMMRAGDKLASYRRLAEALAQMPRDDWRLDIVGDGPVAAEVRCAFAPFGARVRFLGQRDDAGVARALGRAALFVWPGINEAFGMASLGALAAGVPVIAEDRPGLREIVPAAGLVPADAPGRMAARIAALIDDPAARAQLSEAARTRVARRHLLPAARHSIHAALRPLLEPAR